MDTRRTLLERILRFQATCLTGPSSEPLDGLLHDLHTWQVQHAPVVAALTTAPGIIPAVPVDLFKRLPVGTLREGEPSVTFMTSGTTVGRRGVHRMRDTVAYDHGAQRWFNHCVPGAPSEVIALLTAPSAAPESSLSHMVASFGGQRVVWCQTSQGIDIEAFDRACRTDRPVFLATTAFALLDVLPHAGPLPGGSVVMVTGGFKGRETTLSSADLLTQVHATFAPERLVLEYGMTELSSQLWAAPDGRYRAPPWLRIGVVDPQTGEPVPRGTRGQLRFYDAANLDSSVGIETMDCGIHHPDGTLELLGRLPGSPTRGCSLTVEEAWARGSDEH